MKRRQSGRFSAGVASLAVVLAALVGAFATMVARAEPVRDRGPQPARSATILLVRHAEKAGSAGDVGLSSAGQARAARLAAMLKDAEVSAIFTSDLVRTRETAAPLARQRGLSVQAIPAAAIDDLVTKVRALPPGAVALVVHHSNTVPKIAERLGAVKVAPIAEDEFDRLLVVTRSADGTSRVLTLRY